jgi:LysR family glycine cleavage system transcriptional activator
LALAANFFVADDARAGRLLRLFPTASLRGGADFYLIHPRKLRHPTSVTAVKSWLTAQALQRLRG